MNKTLRNALLTLLLAAIVAFSLCVASCDNGGGDVTTEAPVSTEAPVLDLSFITGGTTDYKLTRTEKISNEVKDAVVDLYSNMTQTFKCIKSLTIGTDWMGRDDTEDDIPKHEILIGLTNRSETSKAFEGLGEYDWTIAVVNEKLVITGGGDKATLEAIDYFYENYVKGKDSLVLASDFVYSKIAPPAIIASNPENYYHDFSTDSPTITMQYYANPALDTAKCSVVVDGTDYTDKCKWEDGSITLSGVTFKIGAHTAVVTLTDTAGNTAKHEQHFGCGNSGDVAMNLYKGEVHAHTGDSDGQLTPTDAYQYARDVAGLDFFAVTDHSNSCSESTYVNKHITVADSFNEPGKYVALYGYEQTYNFSTGFYGHLNTLNTATYAVRNTFALEPYYKLMSETTDAIVQFNHPGYKWGNFLEYGLYSADYDRVVNLYEFKGSGYDTEWALCLAKGWHVAPMHNEDNHSPNWGTANEAVGYVLTPALTRANVVEAMNLNRSYTTTDGTMKIFYKINNEWMGARLNNPDSLAVSVEVTTDKASGIGNIYLIGEDNIVVASASVGTAMSYKWEVTVDTAYDYYYIKVNGSSGFAVTAPIWIENRDLISITGLDQSLIVGSEDFNDYRVNASLKNNSTSEMTDVTVSFYSSSLSVLYSNSSTPFATVNVGKIAAGGTASAFADVAYSQASNRITAIVTGKVGGESYSDTLYILLTRTIITEIVPSGAGYTYIEIFNNSDSEIPLSQYSLRYYPKAGADATALTDNTWTLSGTLRPHTVTVVWLRTASGITVDQFNKMYSSSLSESDGSLVIVNVTRSIASADPVQLELLYGTNVVARTWYNWGADGNEAQSGKAVTFKYATEYSLTETRIEAKATPTPGTVDPTMVPAVITK